MPNEDLWKITKQQPTAFQIKMRKWCWIRHTLRKPTGSIKTAALDWNLQGTRRCGRPEKTWKRAVEEEAMEVGKTRSEVKRIAVDRIRWKRRTDALCSRRSNRNQTEIEGKNATLLCSVITVKFLDPLKPAPVNRSNVLSVILKT
jgi:hypothetical protein